MSAMLSLDLSDATTTARHGFAGWLTTDGLRILATIVGAVVLRWLVHRSIDRVVRGTVERADERDRRTPGRAAVGAVRRDWLGVLSGTGSAVIMGAISESMSTFAISAMAILTVMGLLGLPPACCWRRPVWPAWTLGFGAQSLVKDFLSGIFMMSRTSTASVTSSTPARRSVPSRTSPCA